jgi:hypothetical protein
MLVGLDEMAQSYPVSYVGSTVVRRGTPMRASATSELWDATGRRIAVLSVGQNDVSHLATGVYFIREAQAQAQAQAQADGVQRSAVTVRRIVIAE